jgi:hypothetical protein
VPAGYHLTTRFSKGLFIAGTVTFGSTWLLSVVVAGELQNTTTLDCTSAGCSQASTSKYTPLYVPVVGPFIALGTLSPNGGGTIILLLDGVAQAGGIAMAIAGLASNNHILVRNEANSLHLHFAPVVTASTVGLGVSGVL